MDTVEAFGTQAITTGSVDTSPTGIASDEAFGSSSVTTTYNITTTAMGSDEAFGSNTIGVGPVSITVAALDTAESFGALGITVGDVFITCTAMDTDEVWGTLYSIFAQFTVTTAQSAVSVPTGASGCYYRAHGGGGGGGCGYVHSTANRAGGGGGGGGAWIPVYLFQLLVAIPMYFLVLRWVKRDLSPSRWLVAAAVVLLSLMLVSRYTNNNFFMTPLAFLITAYVLQQVPQSQEHKHV
jgi:hypothetical protein